MYQETLEYLIVSKADDFEQTLRSAPTLEDCTYHFAAYQEADSLFRQPFGLDTAVVLDSVSSPELCRAAAERFAREKALGRPVPHTVAAVTAEQAKWAAWYGQRAARLWVLPEPGDAQALKRYFSVLASEMKERADARKQAICFQTLIDSSKDLIWFKDTDGRHLIVNDEFCRFVNKSKQQIYKQGHCYIWDATKEDEKVCLDSDQKIMQGKRTQKFEEQLHTNSGDYIIRSYKSPLAEQGELFGTCGIGQNVTDERNLEKKLQTILDNIPFGVAVVSSEEILTYKNQMFDMYFPQAIDCLGQDVSHLKEQLHFPNCLVEGETAEVEMRSSEGEPVWFSYYEKKILDAFGSQIETMLVVRDITDRKKMEFQREQLAYTDYLTGLSNRRGLLKTLENDNDSSGLTIIMLDIDDFKKINDTFGHKTGDEVLKGFAGVLKKVFVADYVVRYGGDEFLVVTRLDQKQSLHDKMDSLFWETDSTEYGGGALKGIHISCGIATGAANADRTIEELIGMSDEAMYYVKKHGKHGYLFHDEMVGV